MGDKRTETRPGAQRGRGRRRHRPETRHPSPLRPLGHPERSRHHVRRLQLRPRLWFSVDGEVRPIQQAAASSEDNRRLSGVEMTRPRWCSCWEVNRSAVAGPTVAPTPAVRRVGSPPGRRGTAARPRRSRARVHPLELGEHPFGDITVGHVVHGQLTSLPKCGTTGGVRVVHPTRDAGRVQQRDRSPVFR